MRRLAAAAAILVGTAASAIADPPALVGRLSDIEGPVSFHPANQSQWVQATLNFPVVAGDSLWTDPGARAEVQVGPAEIRMDGQTQVDVLRLDDNGLMVRVDQGVVNLHLHATPPGGAQVVTAPGQLDLLTPGTYRVDTGHPSPDGAPAQTEIAVLEGEARLVGQRTAVDLQPGEEAVIPSDQSTLTVIQAEPTPFDDWALARERREAAAESLQYVSPWMTGYQDLDRYGSWTSVPAYGAVWFPTTVMAGWAPYRFGHWAYVAPWGWTWVDNTPWGFTPFHYGRWVDLDGRWGWCPGPRIERPVYAPALVAFAGRPGGDIPRAARGGPAVGWVPLAPGESFHPYYRASPAYVRNVNQGHPGGAVGKAMPPATVTALRNGHAATAVPAATFTGARPVHQELLQGPPRQVAQAPVTARIDRLRPTPEARLGAAPAAIRPSPPSVPHPAGGWQMPMQQHPVAQPRPQLPRPVQQTLPMPTPQGWVRAPQPHPAPAGHPAGGPPHGQQGGHGGGPTGDRR